MVACCTWTSLITPSPEASARYSGAENLSWSRRQDHISLGCCQFLLETPHVTVLSAWSHQCTCASTILKVLGTAKSAGSMMGGSYPCMIWSVVRCGRDYYLVRNSRRL